MSVTSAPNEPLVGILQEVCIDDCYGVADLSLAPGDTIIDIGANVGVFTLWVATRNPEVQVIALEPSPRMCAYLRENITRSGARNVTAVQSACGGATREAVLFQRGVEAANSLYAQDNYGSRFYPLARTEMLTLDDLFQRFDVRRCKLLKMDCEGAEYEILLNASEATLRRIERISMEYHVGLNAHTPQELARFLMSNGFDVQVLDPLDVEGGYLYAQQRPAPGRLPQCPGASPVSALRPAFSIP
jgi:FkbM family methyltransferase